MTQLTNRLSDKNLIELAKQNHEQQQISRMPGFIVNLPSAGKIYPKTSVLREGKLEMRYMTAYDEDILTNASYIKEGIMLDKLVQSLVITPGFNINEIRDADKEQLIISARIAGYGEEYSVTVTSPTGERINETINLNNLKAKPFNIESDENGEFDYIINETTKIKFRYPPSSVVNKIPTDHAITYLLEQIIMQVNESRDSNQISEFIRYELRAPDSRKFRTYVQDNAPGLETTYTFTYTTTEGTQETFEAGFPIGSDFFWF